MAVSVGQDEEPPNDPRIVETIVTLADTNQVSKRTAINPQTGAVGFDQYNNPTDSWEYDFGAGAPGAFLRRTHTDYVTVAAYVNADANASLGASLRGLPSRQWVSSDAAGANKASLTSYAYDQYTLADCPNITGHDSAYSTAFNRRGNLTGVTRYADAAGGAGAVTTSSHYDIAGNAVSATDARGYTTLFDYSDSFSDNNNLRHAYAYPSAVTTPAPDPDKVSYTSAGTLYKFQAGAFGSTTGLTTDATYDFNTGLVASTTDANGETTTFEYNDSFDRITKENRPDGGWTTYQYGTNQYGDYVHTSTLLNSSGTATHSYRYTDGLGRLYRSFSNDPTDPNNLWLTTDAQYDSMGRMRRVSNPYRSAGSAGAVNPAGRWTTTAYDELGRVESVTTPDGAVVTTAYSGNQVTATDRAGRQRISKSDARGLPTEVWEVTPNDATKYPGIDSGPFTAPDGTTVTVYGYRTSYAYDALGNLCAWLPRAGRQARPVGADNNGNVLRAYAYVPLDAAGSYTTGSTSPYAYYQDDYVYDQLNRLTSDTETAGTLGATPATAFVQAYKYDRWGNRTIDASATTNAPEPQFAVDSATNRLLVPAGQAGVMSYDAAGNLTNDTYTGQGSRVYDAENKMTQAQDVYQSWSTYTYDGDGRRVKRLSANQKTWQVYGVGGELLAEYQAGAAPMTATKEYGYRGGELLVTMSSGDDQRLKRFVTNLYYGALQRDPTTQELQDKSNQLASAGVQGQAQLLQKAKEIARALFTQTFYETSPARSDSQYVTDLYYAYTQRGPDASGLSFWTAKVAAERRSVTCDGFEGSTEFTTLVSTLYGTATSDNQRTEQYVNDFYLAAYGRNATASELQQQRDALNAAAAQGQSQVQAQAEAMGRALFASQVTDLSITAQQFVTNLYEGFLQRGPDASGLSFWTTQAGTTAAARQGVLNAFATCPPASELSGTLYRETFWLVSDHLGTPRMVADRSGGLAGIKRHDYLPFGEEIPGDQNWRTSLRGYVGDTVRRKFTGKERDNETGMDFFGARFYSSTLGRFTGSDPLFLELKRVNDPQRLNLYSYARNNPLEFIDPTGLDVRVTGDLGNEYSTDFNNRKGAAFRTAVINGMLRIIGANGKPLSNKQLKALGSKLSGREAALFTAITDSNHHATVNTGDGEQDPSVFFGRAMEPGLNKLDFTDIRLLDAASNEGGLTSSEDVAHETLEAYLSAVNPSDFGITAHDEAGSNENFPGYSLVRNSVVYDKPDSGGMVHGLTFDAFRQGTLGGNKTVFTQTFVTPVPQESLPRIGNAINPNLEAIPGAHNTTKVQLVKPGN